MPPLTLTYSPVASSRLAAGGGDGLMSGRSIFTPPPLFSLKFLYLRASARSATYGTFRPFTGLRRAALFVCIKFNQINQ